MKYKILIFAFIFVNCNAKIDTECISVNLTENITIKTNEISKNILRLKDSNCNVILNSIKRLSFIDNYYVICAKNQLIRFDATSGNLINIYSCQGRAKNEYIGIWDFWLKSNEVYIYDMNGKKVLKFNFEGDYISTIEVTGKSDDKPFQTLINKGSNEYIGKRVFGIGEIPELSLYNDKFEYIKDIDGTINLKSGLYLNYPLSHNHKGEIIYFRNFYNDIYVIDGENNMTSKYIVSFNKNNIPKENEFKDEYEIIDFLNDSNFKYASLMSNVYESEIYVTFRFIFDKNKYIAIYDKNMKRCKTYNFETYDDYIIDDIYVNQDRIIAIMSNQNETSIINIGINEIIRK